MTTWPFDSIRPIRAALAAAALGSAALLSAAASPAHARTPVVQSAPAGQEAPAASAVPEIAGTTVLLSSDVARLELELASGDTHSIELAGGRVRVDGREAGGYEPGGAFERAWRELLRSPEIDETGALPGLLAAWRPAGADVGATGAAAVLDALDRYDPSAAAAGQEADARAAGALPENVMIVPRAGSIEQLAERLRELNETLGRISGEEFELDGDFALVVHDDYRIAEGTTVRGDVALLGGHLSVDGAIDGNVLVLGGKLELEPGATVRGDVRSMGGEVETAGATVTGEILSLSMPPERAEPARPDVGAERDAEWDYDRRERGPGILGSIVRNVERTVNDLVGTAVWILGLTLLGALLIYFSPRRLEAVATEARADVLRSFGVGLAGQLLFFPILLLLVVLIVTWLVVPFYVLAVAVAVPAGFLAVARGLGEAVVDREYELFDRFNLNRQNTYYYVLNGVIVLLAPFAVAAVLQLFGDWLGFLRGLTLFVAVVLTWAAATTGFGAVILTRGGGLMRDFPSFRRKRSVPLDDLRPEPPGAADEEETR